MAEPRNRQTLLNERREIREIYLLCEPGVAKDPCVECILEDGEPYHVCPHCCSDFSCQYCLVPPRKLLEEAREEKRNALESLPVGVRECGEIVMTSRGLERSEYDRARYLWRNIVIQTGDEIIKELRSVTGKVWRLLYVKRKYIEQIRKSLEKHKHEWAVDVAPRQDEYIYSPDW